MERGLKPRQDHLGISVEMAEPLGGAGPHERYRVGQQRHQHGDTKTWFRRIEMAQLVGGLDTIARSEFVYGLAVYPCLKLPRRHRQRKTEQDGGKSDWPDHR